MFPRKTPLVILAGLASLALSHAGENLLSSPTPAGGAAGDPVAAPWKAAKNPGTLVALGAPAGEADATWVELKDESKNDTANLYCAGLAPMANGRFSTRLRLAEDDSGNRISISLGTNAVSRSEERNLMFQVDRNKVKAGSNDKVGDELLPLEAGKEVTLYIRFKDLDTPQGTVEFGTIDESGREVSLQTQEALVPAITGLRVTTAINQDGTHFFVKDLELTEGK